MIRYLLLRCFSPECIVEDSQPGWFNSALVRTHLIVAKRLPIEVSQEPLSTRGDFPDPAWIQIAPEAGSNESLVGGAFVGDRPEAGLVGWLRTNSAEPLQGIRRLKFDSREEWNSLESRISTKVWYLQLERTGAELRFHTQVAQPRQPALPVAVRDVLQEESGNLCLLKDVGIHVGQGLRTGCNQFFYVTECFSDGNGVVRVITSDSLGGQEFAVPEGALRPGRSDGNPKFRVYVLDRRRWDGFLICAAGYSPKMEVSLLTICGHITQRERLYPKSCRRDWLTLLELPQLQTLGAQPPTNGFLNCRRYALMRGGHKRAARPVFGTCYLTFRIDTCLPLL